MPISQCSITLSLKALGDTASHFWKLRNRYSSWQTLPTAGSRSGLMRRNVSLKQLPC
ncbi:hypothetical protein DSM3645_03028 [Blastopirellula marina DSM 3645]|uniref:Uncharacterized protein n=1 Tax=Blastopirellula marina DSM 3645 TaxID=314230 RepID=A3ZVR9_9BACT|nr:hypothetical protein DSM3645_03028 [Blastopirellula marina DSM 3645]